MNQPTLFSEPDAAQLREEAYFASLVEAARRRQLFSDADWERLQAELTALLAVLTRAFTRAKTSSVRVETAQSLLESTLFVLGVRLKSFDTPENAVQALKTQPVCTLFDAGQQSIARRVLVCRTMHKRLAAKLFDTPNVFFRETAIGGISGFFRLYNPRFAAHEIHITADYPVFLGRPITVGIEFIEQYLRCLEAENTFMSAFAPDAAARLFQHSLPDYARIPINLFEPLILSAMGLVCVKKDPRSLRLCLSDLPTLENMLGTDVERVLQTAFERVMTALDCPRNVRSYGALCLPKFCAETRHALRLGTLRQTFWTVK